MLRDFAGRGLQRPWLDGIAGELDGCAAPGASRQVETGRRLLDDVRRRIEALLACDPRTASAHIRTVVDHMCRLTDWVALTLQLDAELEAGVESDTADSLELYRLRVLERVDPQETPELLELEERLAKGM